MYEIIIDPGHGGSDPGAVGNGLVEKDFNLDISLYMFERFKDLGFSVGITRDVDISITPDERVALVKNMARHCISNHINGGGGDGLEIIHSIHNDGSEAQFIANRIVAKGQNLRQVFSKAQSDGQDYYYMHRRTGTTRTYIMEYGFVDSPKDDPEQLKNDWMEYAEAVIEAFCVIYGKTYKRDKEVNRILVSIHKRKAITPQELQMLIEIGGTLCQEV